MSKYKGFLEISKNNTYVYVNIRHAEDRIK